MNPNGANKALSLPDMRITRLMHSDPERCATVNEYAAASGSDVAHIIDVLSPALDTGALKLEPVGPEIFVHTAPHGRPVPAHLPEVPPNLWERVRTRNSASVAALLWQQVRELQAAGWNVVVNPIVLNSGMSYVPDPPQMGILVRDHVAPVLAYPTQAQILDPDGQWHTWARAGATVIAILTESGNLDAVSTAVRAQYRSGQGPVTVVCEAPRYHPVILTPADASVAPRSVTRGSDDATGPRPPA